MSEQNLYGYSSKLGLIKPGENVSEGIYRGIDLRNGVFLDEQFDSFIAPEEYETLETTDGRKLTQIFPRGIWFKTDKDFNEVYAISDKPFDEI